MNIYDLARNVYNIMPKKFKQVIIYKIRPCFYSFQYGKICKKAHKHYIMIQKQINKKIIAGSSIRVGFYVVYDSVFSAKPVFEKMLSDNIFDPYLVIIPDVSRGHENMLYQLNKTYRTFLDLFNEKRVLFGYNKQNNDFIDYSDRFDIVSLSNPYDTMTHKYFQIWYLKDKDLLTFHTNYGFFSADNYSRYIIQSPFMSLAWKVFVETEYGYKEFKRYGVIKGKNVSLTGYSKLDEYAVQKKIHSDRKRIIIAPHHTILNETSRMARFSNFMEYADFFLKLPIKYPEIDFIFRPHPLLVVNLARDDIWGKKKTDMYLNKLLSHKNVMYSNEGSYYDIFLNSDAMIHDCSSFLVEYLVTGHPCCYMFRNTSQINALFSKLGRKCLDFYYKAFNENDIINFIDNTVIKEMDTNKKNRDLFVDQYIKINYPNVSDKILLEIKEAISGKALK